jgi:DNA primase
LQLINLLESVLGISKVLKKGEHSFYCPFCNHYKKKLQVNVISQKWRCWVCDKKGGGVFSLFRLLNVSREKMKKLDDFKNDYIGKKSYKQKKDVVQLPDEFKPLWKLSNTPEYRNALHYLKGRGVDIIDIRRYNIGYCETGDYSGMIIIPSYDLYGSLNFFTGRSYYQDSYMKHKNPPVSKDVIGFENMINWRVPITIVEGAFDAITVRMNCIPLYGKVMLGNLKKMLLLKGVKEVNLALDPDALHNTLETAKYFMNEGIKVMVIPLKEKDPSDMGRGEFLNLVRMTNPLDLSSLVQLKFMI